MNSLRSNLQIAWDLGQTIKLNAIFQRFVALLIPPATHIALWPDWASFVAYASPLVLVSLTIVTCITDRERKEIWRTLLWLAIGLSLAGVFLGLTGEFTFLIDYERGNYADRLFVIAQFFLLPPALIGASVVFARARRSSALSLATFVLFAAAWSAAQAYNALPRYDAAVSGHGWSVGKADFEAVRFIDRDAGGQKYTVLANQSVSAAAVETFGFKRYADDVFYYPIPTGAPLYDVFLKAVGQSPTRETVKEAAELGQSSLVYVVLNNYWWNADRVGEALSSSSDQTNKIENGKTRVYKFDFSNDKNL